MKKRIIIIIFVVLFLGVSLLVYFGQRKTQTRELYYSGTIYLCPARDHERQCYEDIHDNWNNGLIEFFDKSDGFVPTEYEYRRKSKRGR